LWSRTFCSLVQRSRRFEGNVFLFLCEKKSEPFSDLDRFVSVVGMLTGTHSYAVGLNYKNGVNLEVLTRNPEHSKCCWKCCEVCRLGVRCDANILGQFKPIFRRHTPFHLPRGTVKTKSGILPPCPQYALLFRTPPPRMLAGACISSKHHHCKFCRTK